MKNIFLLLLFMASTLAHAASSPTLIPFQGRLTDQVGTPYTNGQYTLIFNLYDQAVGGNVLWTETHQKVGVINGTVNVFLGSINAALTSVDFSQTRHLGITIDPDNNPNTPDPEMVPRQMIISAFWAKNAEKLAGYDWTPLVGVNNPSGALDGSKVAAGTLLGTALRSGTVSSAQLGDGSVSNSKLLDGAVTLGKLATRVTSTNAPVGGVATNGFLGVQRWQSLATETDWPVSNLVVKLTTVGRPVVVSLSGWPGTVAPEAGYNSFVRAYTTSDNTAFGWVLFVRNQADVISGSHFENRGGTTDTAISIPSSAFSCLDFPPAGTHEYLVKVRVPRHAGGDPARPFFMMAQNIRIQAYELP